MSLALGAVVAFDDHGAVGWVCLALAVPCEVWAEVCAPNSEDVSVVPPYRPNR